MYLKGSEQCKFEKCVIFGQKMDDFWTFSKNYFDENSQNLHVQSMCVKIQNQTPNEQITKIPKNQQILLTKCDMFGPKLPWKTGFSEKI